MSIARGPTWRQLALDIMILASLHVHQYTFGLEFAHSQIFHKFLCFEYSVGLWGNINCHARTSVRSCLQKSYKTARAFPKDT